ncbi:hypothetical protein FIBSPDRAFT_868616 [Athelia psychrophila]|uniref:Uncharacterized protein n=1 Tax=Athelia psychrophila TaxID=1759441 RepID=A0A166CXT0_9AGAM|nr:hypothetical protein FIBSPDRAFT_868616 [Fibularhizoctonia sp. CBS 109695]
MRLKLQTTAPLDPLKVWLPLPADLTTVTSLKHHLATYLPALVSLRVKPRDLTLLLDGFELLDDSEVGVLRDGDLICIGLVPSARSLSKRKAAEDPISLSKKIKRPLASPPAKPKSLKRPIEAVSMSSSSSSSSSDSDSDDSDSDSDSDSSGSSTSSSSSSPSIVRASTSSKQNAANNAAASKKSNITVRSKLAEAQAYQAENVPPGLGKPSTHSRNKRRKLKQAYARGAVPPTPAALPNPSASPLPASRENTGAPSSRDLGMLALLSKNKNKKKHFKASFAQALPQKIVFGAEPSKAAPSSSSSSSSSSSDSSDSDSDSDSSSSEPSKPQPGPSQTNTLLPTQRAVVSVPQTPAPKTTAARPRLIPPSERQAAGTLPPGLFVTSIDVEEGLAPPRGRKGKKGKGKMQAPDEQKEWVEEEWMDPESFYADPDVRAVGQPRVGPVTVPHVPKDAAKTNPGKIDFVKVEKSWASYPKIVDKAALRPGCVVGWWGLAINPRTFTPESLLNIARLTSYTDDPDEITLTHIPRPGYGVISFGRSVEYPEGDDAELEEVEEMSEVYTWSDVTDNGDWRLVSA